MAPQGPAAILLAGGASTSVGRTLAAAAAAVRAGVAAFTDHPYVVDRAGKPVIAARAEYLPVDLGGVERLLALAEPAAREALAALQGTTARVPVFIGLPEPRPGVPDALAGAFCAGFAQRFGCGAEIGAVRAVPLGHSAGLIALEAGWRELATGRAEAVLVGGADSYLDGDTLEWLESEEQLHSAGIANNAWGFVPGEAAAFVLLVTPALARRLGPAPLGSLQCLGRAREVHPLKSDAICLGAGLTEALQRAFDGLPSATTRIDDIICDMNGEPYRAEEFGFASIRHDGRFVDPARFMTPADCWGDVGAASGPLFAGLADVGHRKRYLTGRHTLLWTSSEGGERAAAILDFGAAAGGRRP